MIPFLPRLSDYDVSAIHGFLPTDPPCDRLADPYYQPWEDVIYSLHTLILTKRIRPTIDRLPILSIKYLRTLAEWRRAYSILGFIVHSYVWGGHTPVDVSDTDLECLSGIPGSEKFYWKHERVAKQHNRKYRLQSRFPSSQYATISKSSL